MTPSSKRKRVLLALFPLEVHSRGVRTVAYMLREAGVEVVYIGNASSEKIIDSAIQEGVDGIGISTYCGGELILGKELIDVADAKGVKDNFIFLIGGIIPADHIEPLMNLGFQGVFPSSSPISEILDSLHNET